MTIQTLTTAQKKKTLERALNAFQLFCKQNFDFDLYGYQLRIARACLSSLLVEPKDVFVKLSRQSGKTETITLILRFLIIFYVHFTGNPLMAGIASPKGEQAKTDLDRIKKSLAAIRSDWGVEDREFNSKTVRAYIGELLHAEIYKFSLANNTSNESKTLNLLVVEEAHKANDTKRSDELDPMLASTGGVTWMIGVGSPRMCDFKRGCDGELPESVAVVVDAQEVIRDRRKMYERTGNPRHLEYEKAFERELRKKGRDNPEIRLNYFLEDIVETGNFVSRERLLSCGRGDERVPLRKLFFGIDWGRKHDSSWAFVGNDHNDVVDMLKLPHVRYDEQIQLLNDWLREKRIEAKEDGSTVEYTYEERILAAKGDSTGQGDMPMETLETDTKLPIQSDSHVKFTMQSKNEMYQLFEAALYREESDPMRFSYPADHPLAAEFEDQMVLLVREYKGDGEYLSVHHPDEPGALDDAPDGCALMLFAASEGGIGELLIA